MTYYGVGDARLAGQYYYRGPCNCGGGCGCGGIEFNYYPQRYTVYTFKGSTLKVKFDFPYSIIGGTVFVSEASTVGLMDPDISGFEGDDDSIELTWTPEQLEDLKSGDGNFFRVGFTTVDDIVKTYPLVYIDVR